MFILFPESVFYNRTLLKIKNPYAGKSAKARNHHPTVKPLALMEYLCRLTATPTDGTVLDPFAGSGTTGLACIETRRDYILIERELEYCEIIKHRIESESVQMRF